MSTFNDLTEPKSSLPTFTSIHDQPARRFSQVDSSNASSRRSATGSGSQTRSNHNDEPQHSPSLGTREEDTQAADDITRANGTVKRLKRSSGGFLINSSPASSRLSRSLLSRRSVKGKEKSEDTPLPPSKIRNQVDGQGLSSSFRDSLGPSDVRSSPSDLNRGHDPAQSSRNTPESLNQNGSIRSHRSSEKSQTLPSFGFDTDPAQIVDMALRLNEGRRLQASGKRLASSGLPGRRIVSSATSTPSKFSPPSKPAHRSSLNPVSRHKTPDMEPVTPQQTQRDLAVHTMERSPILHDGFSPEQDVEDVDKAMQISRATQNRVAKAKAYFELAYEHRRLLSHLPPVRPPNVPFQSDKPGFDSKVYNPLQYARNRKLRFRERHPIDSEAEGWYDVEKVRTWVDAVVDSTPATHHDPLQIIRLPPLTLLEKDAKEPTDDEENADSNIRRRPTKVRRPKSDWVTHPGDLIADAFWTEQGLNKKKIYNRDNEPIYPSGTKFMFSGWRDRAPLDVPEELKSSSPEVSPLQNKKLIDSPPDLPAFESAHKDHTWERAKSKFGRTLKKDKKSKKTSKDRDIFDTSSDSSDSIMSIDDLKDQRGRRRLAKGRDKLALLNGDPFSRPVQSAEKTDSRRRSSEFGARNQDSTRESMDRASLLRYLRRSSTSTTGHTDDGEKTKPSKRRRLLETIRLDSDVTGRSSLEYDSTAPGTPTHGFPSIAIDLSPPHSRSPSPGRKDSATILGAVKDKALSAMNSREQKDHKNHIDRTDFAQPVSQSSSRSRSSISPHEKYMSRTASPMTRGVSPGNRHHKRSVDETMPYPVEHRHSNLSKASSRATDNVHRHHRVRGMFKGGRIAELVGHEVNRVGDFIWKREPPRTNTVDGGSISGYETESDDFSDYDMDKSARRPPKKVSRTSLTNSPTSVRSLSPTGKNSRLPSSASAPSLVPESTQPQFHVQGLPSFTSPFDRDRQTHYRKSGAESPGGTPIHDVDKNSADPISTGNAASKAGRSPRFDRLAPPKLDITSATPDGRRSSYGFGLALPDLTRTVSASQDYNSAINSDGYYRPRESTRVSSLAIPYFNDAENSSQTDLSLARTRSSANPKHVTVHDYCRLRGLLISVAVKATNIATYCEEVPNPQSSFLYSAFEATNASGTERSKNLPAPRKREHAIAARHLISHLHTQSADFNDRLNHFTSSTTVNLQREIQILEDNSESSLFPRLQALSDQAGQLAQQLTMTSTRAVRNVNDEVTEAARMKRRGPFRISRWFWFKLIEFGVIGLLWGVWFIVMMIRVLLGVSRGVAGFIAWMLWLR